MTKISLYVDEEVWAKFREKVFRKHGNLRKLSDEVETLLSFSLVEGTIISGFEKLGLNVKGTISSQEVKEGRCTPKGPPSEKVLEEMRRKRVAEALSRQ